ncbi:MAG: helix-turn-helix domain-containing protein [Crenarchaeota archaeon]|nr:helix-turn-helix domain-containing protein [Thermoproteota archaeon]MCR8453478.1 helix-turn-helix domain-containing protein [Thermoproteota archaeon]MCR8454877.1 helix-turn-helix domain-containing protein [Thermoproteota archaeon]MCR8462763.1 helix-turn-helix domain-containing protein [Thermoproteota archaeon]MCR8470542.1 helix-turn-helix domain-containing protein [Thermoproteota archaeon]
MGALAEKLVCEICGRPVHGKKFYVFQDIELLLCEICAKQLRAKEIVAAPDTLTPRKLKDDTRKTVMELPKQQPKELEYDYVKGFGDLIRNARIKKGLKPEKLAMILGISPSYLLKIEREKVKPELHLAQRIEKVLNVRILVRVDTKSLSLTSELKDEPKPFTLGDILLIEKPKKKSSKMT